MYAGSRTCTRGHPRLGTPGNHTPPQRRVATAGHSLSRQGHPTLAHRFSGGTAIRSHVRSPDRGDRISHSEFTPPAMRSRFCRRLPSLTGLVVVGGIALPPLKRWAIVVHPTIWGDDPSPGGFFEASLRCPGLAERSVDLLQCPCQEKRRQALRGSNLPRNLLVSDAPTACQPLAEGLGQGPLGVPE